MTNADLAYDPASKDLVYTPDTKDLALNCPPSDCPAGCDGVCPSSFTAVVTGTGTGSYMSCQFDDTYTLTLQSACYYLDEDAGLIVDLECVPVNLPGTPTAFYRFRVDMVEYWIMTAEIPLDGDGCPTPGTYTLTGTPGLGCNGFTGTVEIS